VDLAIGNGQVGFHIAVFLIDVSSKTELLSMRGRYQHSRYLYGAIYYTTRSYEPPDIQASPTGLSSSLNVPF
jgi:hypothetical protein